MKIGILTYHRAHNYGAMLQAYALKQFLQMQGHEVELIDYWPKAHQQAYALFPGCKQSSWALGLKESVARGMTLVRRTIRYMRFEQFAQAYLSVPHSIQYPNPDVIRYPYDIVITGSDQIWRNYNSDCSYLGHDWVYFCKNIPPSVRRIAYAASMGILQNTIQEEEKIKRNLTAYQAIMVREMSLHAYLQSLDISSKVVCDPTFLLSREQWNKILPSERYHQRRYVLFYELLEGTTARKQAEAYAEHHNYDFVVITARVHPVPHRCVRQMESPLTFLQAIRDAEMVIATSFHGTAFSIIFEKNFMVTGLGANHARITSLLEKVHLLDRYYENSIPTDLPSIHYADVTSYKEAFIQDSVSALLKSIA